jgi:hypothetical protein
VDRESHRSDVAAEHDEQLREVLSAAMQPLALR